MVTQRHTHSLYCISHAHAALTSAPIKDVSKYRWNIVSSFDGFLDPANELLILWIWKWLVSASGFVFGLLFYPDEDCVGLACHVWPVDPDLDYKNLTSHDLTSQDSDLELSLVTLVFGCC